MAGSPRQQKPTRASRTSSRFSVRQLPPKRGSLKLLWQSSQRTTPDYTINTINTDYTTTGTYNQMQTHLQGHADTTLILSMYTPDISQGVVKAVEDAGLLGKVNIVDQGFGKFSIDQIEAGNIQFSTLFFPYNGIKVSLEAIAAAQRGGDTGPPFRG